MEVKSGLENVLNKYRAMDDKHMRTSTKTVTATPGLVLHIANNTLSEVRMGSVDALSVAYGD